jgi:hypothetical protein
MNISAPLPDVAVAAGCRAPVPNWREGVSGRSFVIFKKIILDI